MQPLQVSWGYHISAKSLDERDEYGSTHSVDDRALPSSVAAGDNYAYRVSISSGGSGNALTLVSTD